MFVSQGTLLQRGLLYTGMERTQVIHYILSDPMGARHLGPSASYASGTAIYHSLPQIYFLFFLGTVGIYSI